MQAAVELTAGPFKLKHIGGLKQKHVRYLYEQWQTRNLSAATIKNRTAHLRWACEVLSKTDVVPSNDALSIGRRQYSNNQNNKAVDLDKIDLFGITSRHVLVQLHLQRYLGLRREESIKLKPLLADKGDHVVLQPTWCKGKRGRTITITMPEARHWLDEAKKLVSHKDQSLILENKNYIQHRRLYDHQVKKAGIKHPHGLRHAYAQERYKTLTGWECPKRGGPTAKQLTFEQRKIDHNVRLTISQELGHNRKQILAIYCG